MINHDSELSVLVSGATGQQGGATARALLARGIPVRALVRNPNAEKAQALKALGATLFQGDLNDPDSLQDACRGVRGVFSVQMPDMNNMESDMERVQCQNLVSAARALQVPQFVHTSVSGSERSHPDKPGWDERWNANYYISKNHNEQRVREAGFDSWTVLKPSFFMENLIRPSFMFANFVEDRLLTILKPDQGLALIAVADIGEAAAVAFQEPGRFHQQDIELAGDRLTLREIAAVLSACLGKHIEAPDLTVEQALEQGLHPALIQGQDLLNKLPSLARPERAHELGLKVTDFKTWAVAHWK
jgi:uncharacterized protein YbjT (DUF2867 family)